MYLFLCSQDLVSLTVGILDGHGSALFMKTLASAPEQFLFNIDQCVREWQIDLATLCGVVAVTGPGSFTSSRLSVTIANTIAFRYEIPVIGVENVKRLSVDELLSTIDLSQTAESIQPTYDRPPHIT